MIQSGLRIGGVDAFVEGPSPSRHGASRVIKLLRASLLGGTALALLIGAGSGAQSQTLTLGTSGSTDAIAIGAESVAALEYATAVGYGSQAMGQGGSAFGYRSKAAFDSVAMGVNAEATGGNLAVGVNASAYEQDAAAVGNGAVAGVAGDPTVVRGTALGALAKATASKATALGFNAAAVTDSSIALGVGSVAGAPFSLLGQDPPVPATRAVAIGPGAKALAQSSVVIGDAANVQNVAAGGIAIGANANVQHSNSVALGANSQTQAGVATAAVKFSISAGKTYDFAGVTADEIKNLEGVGVVSVGGGLRADETVITRQIQFVAPGRLSADSTDAVNGSQLDATNTVLSRILGSNYGKTTEEGIEAGSSLALGIGSKAGDSDPSKATTDYFATALGVSSTASANYATALGYSSQATGLASSALGASSNAQGAWSTALGYSAQATKRATTAIGHQSEATGDDATALGKGAKASANRTLALGANSGSSGVGSSAIGISAKAFGFSATAVGENAVAGVDGGSSPAQGTALGSSAQASATNATALGYGANAKTLNSVALGAGSVAEDAANASVNVVLGGKTYAFAGAAGSSTSVVSVGGRVYDDLGSPTSVILTRQIQNVAAGSLSATSTDAVNGSQLWQVKEAMGAVVTADGVSVGKFETGGTITARKIQNVAAGALSATSTDGVNGSQLYATNQAVIATDAKIGAVVSGSDVSVADRTTGVARKLLGVANGALTATSTDAVNGSQLYVAYQAIGRIDTKLTGVTNRLGAETGASSSAYGAGSKASADYASAVGVNAAASASNATAIGYNAQASTANSVALGTNSTTTAATPVAGGVVGGQSVVYAGGSPVGVVSVGSVSGERQIQNVAAGQVTRASTDAVNGSQLFATNQAIDRTNQVVATLGQSLDALAVGVNQLSNRVGVVQKEARGGIAAAVALVNAPMPSQPGKTSWAGNVAKFRDQYAMGVSFSHRLNSNIPLAMTAGFAYMPGTSDVTGRFGMAGEF